MPHQIVASQSQGVTAFWSLQEQTECFQVAIMTGILLLNFI